MSATVVFFIGLLSLLHFAFYSQYVLYQNKNLLTKTYTQIEQILTDDGSLTTDYLNQLESHLGLKTIVLTSDFALLYESRVVGVGQSGDDGTTSSSLATYKKTLSDNLYRIEEDGYFHAIQEETGDGTSFLYLFGALEGGNYIILRTSLPAIEANIEYSRFFIFIAGLITLCVSVIIAYYISGRFIKPLLEINSVTKRMVGLDFSQKYTGPVEDEVGELGANINILSDELRNTIGELQQTNLQLEGEVQKERQIDEMRQNLIANVSHELKTPLAIIQGYAEGLKEGIGETKEDRDFYCQVIIEESERMNKLVRQILNLSQIELGKVKPEVEKIEITALVATLLTRAKPLLKDRDITIQNMVEKTMVLADEEMLGQVLLNLLSNAIDHTPKGAGIQIYQEYYEGKIRIYIFNEGENIAKEDLQKIWLSFYKVDKARTRTYGGTGIGLTIVKTIIEAHNNKCGVENREDGVAFWFELDIG